MTVIAAVPVIEEVTVPAVGFVAAVLADYVDIFVVVASDALAVAPG